MVEPQRSWHKDKFPCWTSSISKQSGRYDMIGDHDVLIIALTNMDISPASINVWLPIGYHTNNRRRYVNMSKFYQVLGNILCVALPGIHGLIGSDYTASFNRKGKNRSLQLLKTNEDAKITLFCFKRTIALWGKSSDNF